MEGEEFSSSLERKRASNLSPMPESDPLTGEAKLCAAMGSMSIAFAKIDFFF